MLTLRVYTQKYPVRRHPRQESCEGVGTTLRLKQIMWSAINNCSAGLQIIYNELYVCTSYGRFIRKLLYTQWDQCQFVNHSKVWSLL